METGERADVLVVGAGPAGSACALLLARAGLRVAIIEKASEGAALHRDGDRAPKLCGEYLSPGCRPLLERLGLLAAVRARSRPLRGFTLRTRGGRVLELIDAVPPSPASLDGDGALAEGLSISRAVLDPILLEAALGAGAMLLPGFQVSDLLRREGGEVRGVSGLRDGRPASLEARLVVGADGRASAIARRLGRVRRHPRLDKAALGALFAGVRRSDDRGEIFLGRRRYAIFNPLGPDLTNVAFVTDRRRWEGRRDLPAFLAELAAIHPELPARIAGAHALSAPRALAPLAQRASVLAAPGALLIGDAAGFLDPFTGEGIHAALRTAELAAAAAAVALADAAPVHPHLTGYARAWRAVLEPKWRLCMALQQGIRLPWLAEGMVARLRPRPALASFLFAAVGDLLPPAEIGVRRLLARVAIGR